MVHVLWRVKKKAVFGVKEVIMAKGPI
ncbi:hypothetical protein CCACVL1_01492 [Corchorus capsularis]|uniref:Uncharacterized protein n=1 Tax=Corchorus capsularis TaxID=210143 RepID=A0A1R3KHQ7_COCAP|nr:hypothetical protein CCACVL1_01492 [Corchorus capsularis]